MLGGHSEARQAEFTAFVNTSATYLTRTAFLLCGNEETAHDLVQETILRTYAAWWRVRPDDARAYARRVLVNLNIDRRRRPPAVPTQTYDAPDSRDAEGRSDDRDQLRRMLASLPPLQRRVIVLRYFDDLTEVQVAECLGIGVGSVKSAASRGLARIRTNFGPVLKEEKR